MKRTLALALMTLALLPGCAATHRPEGVVERWLISLNQGAAGAPQDYATEAATNAIAPGWAARDPGAYDVIEIGRAEQAPDAGVRVPFRIVDTEGRASAGVALVQDRVAGDPGAGLVVTSAGPSRASAAAVWSAGAGTGAWIGAVVAALFFAGLSIGVVSAIRPRRYG